VAGACKSTRFVVRIRAARRGISSIADGAATNQSKEHEWDKSHSSF